MIKPFSVYNNNNAASVLYKYSFGKCDAVVGFSTLSSMCLLLLLLLLLLSTAAVICFTYFILQLNAKLTDSSSKIYSFCWVNFIFYCVCATFGVCMCALCNLQYTHFYVWQEFFHCAGFYFKQINQLLVRLYLFSMLHTVKYNNDNNNNNEQ